MMNPAQTEVTLAEKHRRLPRFCFVFYFLAAISAVLYTVFMNSPSFADAFNQNISVWGRRIFAYATNLLPFSLAELAVLLIPLFLILLIRLAYLHYCDSWRNSMIYVGILLSFVALIATIFVWNFAAGYYGTTLDQKLDLERKEVSAEELYQTAEILSSELEQLTAQVIFLPDGSSLMPYSYEEMNDKLLQAYDRFCEKHDFIDSFSSRLKPIMLSEPMSYTHITGVYTFFTGEANINVNFPDYTIPYTAAHELAHQRGIAREDEANFIAFLICMESEDPYIQYSAYLNVYEYVSSALYSADKTLYRKSYQNLPSQIHKEEEAYRIFFEKYKENVAATVSEATNNAYLQSQGAPAGSKSYNMVVDLAVAYYKPHFD